MGTIEGQPLSELSRSLSRPELDVFDRSPDPTLDDLTELVAGLSIADYAYIGWIDFNRLWFKSRFGFAAADQPHTATACQWVIRSGKPLLVRDAAPRTRGFRPMESKSRAGSAADPMPACR